MRKNASPRAPLERIVRLSEIECASETRTRLRPDWDQALGGGITENMIVLVPGPGGSGKTSEVLRHANQLGTAAHPVAYGLSERRPLEAISLRAKQLGVDRERIAIARVESTQDFIDHMRETRATHGILDSWGGFRRRDRDVAHLGELRTLIGAGSLWVICHVTKAGDLAGEGDLEHEVDAVVWVRKTHLFVQKNWHGPQGLRVKRVFARPGRLHSPPKSPAPKRRGNPLRLVR